MAKIIIGLDIGAHTIKAVRISREQNNNLLLAAGYIATPAVGAVLTSQASSDEKLLASTINRLAHDMKVTTTGVSASLPNDKVITRVIEVPQMTEEELVSSIKWEAEQYIPMPLTKVRIDYALISKDPDKGKMKILMVAAPISLIEKYMRIITMAGLTPIALETEILAASRSITTSFPALNNVLVLNIGSLATEIALLYDHSLVFSKSYPVGGETFTRSIAQALGFELAQAEEYKKTYGLDEDKLEGKIARATEPFINNLISEVEKTITFFREQYPKDELKTIILCGGGAKMPGLVLTLTKKLGLDSQINNPLINLSVDPNILPILTPDAPIYSTSIGLALKDIA